MQRIVMLDNTNICSYNSGMKERAYLCIDLKSFYASVECVERGLDPMTTNLVVADPERSDKTICLAVSPSMKALGVRNRCRVFEIPKNIDYIMASPRMQKYIDYSAEIYGVYLQYLSKDDIHVYSIDEAFMDVTDYRRVYGCDAGTLALKIMDNVRKIVGVRAACGIGTNMYLSKIALDITAKRAVNFVGYLDAERYRETLWDHKPLTDFWRIGRGISARLAKIGINTMRDIAHTDEELLYGIFGIDAELLIDHAWGREPVTMEDIKLYKPQSRCLASGQVLMCDYTRDEGRIIVKEMMDLICLDLVEKNLLAESVTLSAGYAKPNRSRHAKGTVLFEDPTHSAAVMIPEVVSLYDRSVNPEFMIRRMSITCNNLTEDTGMRQMSFFDVTAAPAADSERRMQETILKIKGKYGKNAMIKALDLEEVATTRERNRQIGGHKSGE
jgi:DNA polymerase V